MADKITTTTAGTSVSSNAPLSVSSGTTVIVDPVVAKIAGIAARDVPGVFALGGGAARAIGLVRDAIGNTDLSQGVKVEVGETQVAVDVTIVVEYPMPLTAVASAVRTAIAVRKHFAHHGVVEHFHQACFHCRENFHLAGTVG